MTTTKKSTQNPKHINKFNSARISRSLFKSQGRLCTERPCTHIFTFSKNLNQHPKFGFLFFVVVVLLVFAFFFFYCWNSSPNITATYHKMPMPSKSKSDKLLLSFTPSPPFEIFSKGTQLLLKSL